LTLFIALYPCRDEATGAQARLLCNCSSLPNGKWRNCVSLM
jgi:hypothetical protein